MADNQPNAISEDGDDAGPLNVRDGRDYSEYFNNLGVTFPSIDEAFAHANDIAMSHGFYLVKASNYTDANGTIRHILRCDRYGVYKSKANPNTATPRKNLSSKKCDCKFTVCIRNGIITSQFGDYTKEIELTSVGRSVRIDEFLKSGLGMEHDFLVLVVIAHIGWVLLFFFVFAYGIKYLNFQRR